MFAFHPMRSQSDPKAFRARTQPDALIVKSPFRTGYVVVSSNGGVSLLNGRLAHGQSLVSNETIWPDKTRQTRSSNTGE